MTTVNVIALEMGFYDGRRIRVGQSFEFDTKFAKPVEGGGYVLPAWVIPDEPGAREGIARMIQNREDKAHAAAIASSGNGASGGAAKRKTDFMAKMRGGV